LPRIALLVNKGIEAAAELLITLATALAAL
jgi:hypothetical protein